MKFLSVKNLNEKITLINIDYIVAIEEKADRTIIYLRDRNWVETDKPAFQIYTEINKREVF